MQASITAWPPTPAELPDLILDTMAEAAGLQPIVVAPVTAMTPKTVVWTYPFDVVAE